MTAHKLPDPQRIKKISEFNQEPYKGKCKFCGNTMHDDYPPAYALFNCVSKEVCYKLCSQCASNIDFLMKHFAAGRLTFKKQDCDPIFNPDEEIPF